MTRARARERLGLSLDDDLVVYTGHLYPDKGGKVLVEAARELDATVSLVGGYKEGIERVKRTAGEPDNVTTV